MSLVTFLIVLWSRRRVCSGGIFSKYDGPFQTDLSTSQLVRSKQASDQGTFVQPCRITVSLSSRFIRSA